MLPSPPVTNKYLILDTVEFISVLRYTPLFFHSSLNINGLKLLCICFNIYINIWSQDQIHSVTNYIHLNEVYTKLFNVFFQTFKKKPQGTIYK